MQKTWIKCNYLNKTLFSKIFSPLAHTREYAAAKSLQSCPTLCDPIDGSPPVPLSLGFSRQEHWSGLPFPSPMHESERWKWSCSVVSDPQWPHGLQPTRLLHPWDFPGRSTRVGCHCLLRLKPYSSPNVDPFSSLPPFFLSVYSLLSLLPPSLHHPFPLWFQNITSSSLGQLFLS